MYVIGLPLRIHILLYDSIIWEIVYYATCAEISKLKQEKEVLTQKAEEQAEATQAILLCTVQSLKCTL